MSKEIRFGIRLTYDGKEVSGGVTANREQLREFGAEAKRSTAAAASGFDNVGGAAARAGSAAEKAAQQVKRSAREAAWLGRQLPMQMTDIVTGLASGQTPFTVLIQQGGQLKDIYGGIGPAVRAVGGYVAGLVNPVTLAAGAVGLLAAAYYQGSREADAMAKAVIMSGNAAGASVGRLQALSGAAAAATGATQGDAAAALADLAATGKVSAEVLGTATEAALRLQRAGVQAIDDTVKHFEALGKSPVEASLKLNEQYGYLTAAVYRQIKALEDQGRAEEAAALAQKTYADAMAERSGKIEERLGFIEHAWRRIKDEAAGAWSAMLGVGREKSVGEKIADLEARLKKLGKDKEFHTSRGERYAAGTAQIEIDAANKELAPLKQIQAEQEQLAYVQAERVKSERASLDLAKEAEKSLDKQAQKKREIARIESLYAASAKSTADIEARRAALAGIEEKYKPAKAAKTEKPVHEGLSATEVMRRLHAEDAREEAAARARGAMQETTTGLQSAYAHDNARAAERTLPAAQRDLAESLRQVEERASGARREIAHKAAAIKDDEAAQAALRAELEKVTAAEAAQKSAVRGLWEEQQAMNASWQHGARQALRDYADEADNAAARTQRAFAGGMRHAEDAVVGAMRGSKDAVRGFVEYAVNELYRIQVAQPFVRAASGWLDKVFAPSTTTDSMSGNAGLAAMASVGGAHSGALVGAEATFRRDVPLSLFSGARRYHGGDAILGPGEVPIIAKRGEGVFTEGQMKKLAPVDALRERGSSINLTYAPVIDARESTPGMLGRLQTVLDRHKQEVRAMLMAESDAGGPFAFATGRRS